MLCENKPLPTSPLEHGNNKPFKPSTVTSQQCYSQRILVKYYRLYDILRKLYI